MAASARSSATASPIRPTSARRGPSAARVIGASRGSRAQALTSGEQTACPELLTTNVPLAGARACGATAAVPRAWEAQLDPCLCLPCWEAPQCSAAAPWLASSARAVPSTPRASKMPPNAARLALTELLCGNAAPGDGAAGSSSSAVGDEACAAAAAACAAACAEVDGYRDKVRTRMRHQHARPARLLGTGRRQHPYQLEAESDAGRGEGGARCARRANHPRYATQANCTRERPQALGRGAAAGGALCDSGDSHCAGWHQSLRSTRQAPTSSCRRRREEGWPPQKSLPDV